MQQATGVTSCSPRIREFFKANTVFLSLFTCALKKEGCLSLEIVKIMYCFTTTRTNLQKQNKDILTLHEWGKSIAIVH